MAKARDYDELNRVVGVCLKSARQAKGITQQELARRLGLHQNTLSYMEAGSRCVRIDRMVDVCDTLGISPVDVMANIMRLTADVPRET